MRFFTVGLLVLLPLLGAAQHQRLEARDADAFDDDFPLLNIRETIVNDYLARREARAIAEAEALDDAGLPVHLMQRAILEGRFPVSRGKPAAGGSSRGGGKNHANSVPCPHKACLNDQRCVDLGCQYCGTNNYCVE